MDYDTLVSILDEIDYKGWQFVIDDKDGHLFVYGAFDDQGELQKTRKWYISPHMTRSEAVQTVLACVLMGEEHEARERFRYKGKRIYGPHFDADVLTEFAGKKSSLDLRPELVSVK